MEAFLDHMIFVCFSFAILGIIFGGFCYLMEKFDNKTGIVSKFAEKFFSYDDSEED
jgi:hypothetical protein